MTRPTVEPVVVSHSELATYRQCPLKHQWAYRERWTQEAQPGSGRSLGLLWHLVMAAHYNAILRAQRRHDLVWLADHQGLVAKHASRAVARTLEDLRSQGVEETELDFLITLYGAYCAVYGVDLSWKILATELRFAVPLPRPDGKPSRFHLKVVIDLIVQERFNRTIMVVDHKSGSSLPHQNELDLDDQFPLYVWALRAERVSRGLTPAVSGALHSAIKTYRYKNAVPPADQLVARTPMPRTTVELDAVAADAYRTAVAAYGKTAPYSSPDPRSCGWKCDYVQAHLLERKGIPHGHTLETYGFVQDFTRH